MSSAWETVPLRRVAALNPPVPEFSAAAPNADVSFLPLEAIWPGEQLDVSRVRPKAEVESGYTRFREGDILIPKITPTFQADRTAIATGLENGFGCGTTEVHVLRPGPLLTTRFAKYVVSSRPFLQSGTASMIGVAGQKRVPESFVLNFRTPLPTLAEQHAIANLLDAETRRIDKLIRKRQRMLGLLDERAYAAVSALLLPPGPGDEGHPEWPWLSGLDPLLPLVPLRRLATIQSGLTVDGSRDVGPQDAVTRPYLRVANVQDGYLNLEAVTEVTVPHALAAGSELRAGDVLMTEGGDLDKLGRGTVWRGEIPGCLHQNHVFAIRPRPGLLDSDYLALLTTTFHGRRYFESTGVRTTNLASTNRSKIMDFPLPSLPVARQRELVELVKTELANLAATTDAIRRQIDLLRDRRQALITAAVSGELDVRRMSA